MGCEVQINSMASLKQDKRTGNYLVRFRYAGGEFLRSTETSSKKEALEIEARVERTIRLLKQGDKTIPPDADAGLWIFTGGTVEAKPEAARRGSVGQICEAYLDEQLSKAASTRKTEKQHTGHLKRLLGETTRLDKLTVADMQRYVSARMKDKWAGKSISSR